MKTKYAESVRQLFQTHLYLADKKSVGIFLTLRDEKNRYKSKKGMVTPMKLDEAIMQADGLLKNNPIPRETKVRWLSELDHGIYNDSILTHEGFDGATFAPYDPETDGDRELLAEAPHDAMYVEFLKMKVNAELYEYARYNANLEAFNAMLDNYKGWYTRNHMPLRRENFHWWG